MKYLHLVVKERTTGLVHRLINVDNVGFIEVSKEEGVSLDIAETAMSLIKIHTPNGKLILQCDTRYLIKCDTNCEIICNYLNDIEFFADELINVGLH